MNGVILLNKPEGITSFDVIRTLRSITKIKKIGHAGTLDPFATGLLIVCISREATRHINTFSQLGKTYTAVLKLGDKTDTGDREGKIIETKPVPYSVEQNVQTVFSSFIGEIDQIPPQFSAIKKNGVRLYKTARKGISIEVEPRKVVIHSLTFKSYHKPYLEFNTSVSKGTYIRSLGEDIANKLNTVGHLTELRRDSIGPFTLEEAINLNDLTDQNIEMFIRPVENFINQVQHFTYEKSA